MMGEPDIYYNPKYSELYTDGLKECVQFCHKNGAHEFQVIGN